MSCEDPRDAAPRARRRLRASWRILLPTVAALAAGGAVAVGAVVGSDGTINGCVVTSFTNPNELPLGTLRVLDPSVSGDENCVNGEEPINWNQVGPQGATGQTGATGPQGSPGQPGAIGPAGPQGAAGSVSVQSGSGLDIFLLLSPSNGLGTLGSAPSGEALSGSSNSSNQAIELDSFSFDTSNTTTIGSASAGAGAGKVHFEIQVRQAPRQVHREPVQGPRVRHPAQGGRDHRSQAVGERQGDPAVQYMLKTVALTDLHVAGESGSPTETIQGVYGAVQFVVYEQNPTGTVKAGPTGGWNQITNQPVTSLKRIG